MGAFDDLGPPTPGTDPFADLGPPTKGMDPFADLAPLAAVSTPDPDPFGIAPVDDPGSLAAGGAASFVDLSKGIVQSLAGGIGAVGAIPSAIHQGKPEIIPQTFEKISGAFPMEPVWDAILPDKANVYRKGFNVGVSELATFPQASENLGNIVLEKTGSPTMAATAATLLQAAPIAVMGKTGRELLKKGAKGAAESLISDIPQETLYKAGKKTTYKRADLQKILIQDPAADPVLFERVTTDPAFRKTLVDAIKKGDLSVEELHPNWLGKILGKEPITTETPIPSENVTPKGALPAAGETGTTPPPPSPDIMPGAPGGAAEPLPGTILETKPVADAANAVALKNSWVRQGFDAEIGADPSGLGFVVNRRVKGMEAPTAPDPFADLAPVSPPEGLPLAAEGAPTPQMVETPSTLTSPGPAAGPEPWTGLNRRKEQTLAPRERRADLSTRKAIDAMTPEERSTALRFDEKTGMKSHRAFLEDEGTKPVKVAFDANGLKWINDNLGHSVGDDALRAIADAIAAADVGDGYRLAGDEMAILADHPEAAMGAIQKVRDILKETEIIATRPDGTEARFKGLTITRGIGGTIDEAFATLNADKEAAIGRGDRSKERGGRPLGLLEVPTGGNEIPVQTAESGQIPRAEGDQEVAHAETGVPAAVAKDAENAPKREAKVDEGLRPAQGTTAEAVPGGGKTPEAVVPAAIAKSDALTPSDPVPELAKGERVTRGNVEAWVEEVNIKGRPAWVAKHKQADSGIVLTEGGAGVGLWTKGQAIERAARNLREGRIVGDRIGDKGTPVPPEISKEKPAETILPISGAPVIIGDTVYFLQGWNKDPQKITHINSDGEIRIAGSKATYPPGEFTRDPTLAGSRKSKPFVPAAPVPAEIAKKPHIAEIEEGLDSLLFQLTKNAEPARKALWDAYLEKYGPNNRTPEALEAKTALIAKLREMDVVPLRKEESKKSKVFVSGMSRPADFVSAFESGANLGVVIGQLSKPMMKKVAEATADRKIFVDNGAYPAFKSDTPVDWSKTIKKYRELADMAVKPENLIFVAPDFIGDPDKTYSKQGYYSQELRDMVDLGVQMIYSIQKGGPLVDEPTDGIPYSHTIPYHKDMYDGLIRGFGLEGGLLKYHEENKTKIIIGIPANEKAWSPTEAAALVRELDIPRVHLLGISPLGAKYETYVAAIEGANENVEITTDAAPSFRRINAGEARDESLGLLDDTELLNNVFPPGPGRTPFTSAGAKLLADKLPLKEFDLDQGQFEADVINGDVLEQMGEGERYESLIEWPPNVIESAIREVLRAENPSTYWRGKGMIAQIKRMLDKADKRGKIEAGKGEPDGLEGGSTGEPGTLPSRPSGVDEGEGDVGAVPREPGGSGDRDVQAPEKGRAPRRSSRGTGDKRPVSEGEGGTGGLVEAEVLEEVAAAVAAADEEISITPGKTDYVLTPEDVDFVGRGAKTRTKDNITAIKLAMELDTENRLATPEEQKILVRFSGWGGLSDAFHGAGFKEDWRNLRSELYDLLDTKDYDTARNSIMNAHYTSIEVIDAMWGAVKAAGFKGGRVLEPGAGVGNFLMRTPGDVRGKTRFTAVELERMTGAILRHLNQSHDVRIQGYQDTALSDNFYDLAISNVPFAEVKILSDPKFTRQKFSLHDYYFAKTLDKVRPGGVIAFITSRYTMDKQDPTVRKFIAEKADLLGAIRLPRTAFKANAATEVVTDIIFLKRRAEGTPAAGAEWMGLKELKRGENAAGVNQYYSDHPENVIGNEAFTGSMYGKNEYTVEPANENLGEAIQKAAERFMAGAYEPRKIAYGAKAKAGPPEIQLEGISAIPESSFLIKDGKVYQRRADKLVEVASSPNAVKKYRQFIDLGAAARSLVTNQLDPEYTDAQFDKDRGALNRLYDAATKGNVRLAHKTNQQFFGEDPNWNLIRALEIEDRDAKTVRKADILSKRVMQPNRKVESASSPRDALLVALRETGTIDLSRIAELLGTTEDLAWKAIQGDAFQTPTGLLEIRDQYLSGNVRKKLVEAEAAAKIDPRFEPNVEALKAVIPEDVPPGDIYVNFGAPWISPEYIDDFVREVLEDNRTTTNYLPMNGMWTVDVTKGRGGSNYALLTSTYGTRRMDALEILQHSLNQQSPKIYDTVYEDGTEKRVINTPATLEAKQKQGELKTKFQEWIWTDEARTKILHRSYNDNFNSFVEPKHDGTKVYSVDGKILVPGQNTGITLRDTQINAVWRTLTEGNTLLWHEVGTGKTFIMAAIAKELRRTGAAQKPMIVVPKVIFGQIQQNLMTLFPDAKILAPSADDFKPANRKRFLYRIATGDWDAVIVTKEHFQRIPPPAEIEEELIREAVDELERAISQENESNPHGKRSPTLRQLIKLLDRLKEQLKAMAAQVRDTETLTFDQLGVDYVMVDEAHYFKNLRYTTRMNGVAGMGNPAGNKRSWDLYVKSTYLNRMTKNRGLVLSTGTPISNSIAELYTIQRYLSPDLLKELDISAFDSWAATFASVETGYEITVEGGYKAKDRFSNFNNMPELSRMVRQVADTVTAQMAGVKRPSAHRITVECPASEEYLKYQDEISERADAIRKRLVDPKIDNFPKLSTDGRHAAVDIRLRVPNAPDLPDSKVNKLVKNVFNVWKNGKEGRLTQLVFLDLGVERVKTKKKAAEDAAGVETVEAIRTYTDIKRKLLALGIPEKELALIQDKKYDTEEGRLALYDAVNEGKVRVLIGSTSKMSEGMNVQKRLVALHHMDPTWTPMGIMQREGRILRQGNTNEDVEIYTYLTTGRGGRASFDAFMWQLMESKAGPISELQTNATPSRTMGDVSGIVLNAAEWKALSTGNPLVVEKVKLQDESNRLSMLANQHRSNIQSIPHTVQAIRADANRDRLYVEAMKNDLAGKMGHPNKDSITIGGKKIDVTGGEGQKERMAVLSKAIIDVRKKVLDTPYDSRLGVDTTMKMGEYRGKELRAQHLMQKGAHDEYHSAILMMNFESGMGRSGFSGIRLELSDSADDGLRLRGALERAFDGVTQERIDLAAADIEKALEGAKGLEKEANKPFKDAKRLEEVTNRLAAVDAELGIPQENAAMAASAEILLDAEDTEETAAEESTEPQEGGPGTTLYASPLDPALIAQAWRSLKQSTEELRERHRFAKNAKGLDLQWFNKQVNTPFYIFTEKFPRYRGVFDRMRKMMQERDDIASSLATDAVEFFSTLEYKEKDAVNKLLIKGRYQRKIWTRAELETEGKLSTRQIDAYLGIRAMLDRALSIYEDAILYRITKGKLQASSNLSIDLLKDSLDGLGFKEDKIEQIVSLVQKMRDTKRKGYAPFSRFGDYSYGYVHVGEDGKPDWQNPSNYFAKEETAWKAAEKYQALLKRFAKGIAEGRLIPIPPKKLNQKEEAALLQDIGGFELDAIKRIMSLDPEVAADLKDTVEQFFQAQGFRKHFFESKDSPGFSTDMERALADYIVSISGFVSRIKGVPEMDNAAAGMDRIPELAKYYREWKQYSLSPQEEFHQLRAGLFLYFLGGNVKSAAINLTQTLAVTVPWLTQYVSTTRALTEVTRAVKDMAAAMGKREDGTFGVVIEKLPKDVREIVRRGYDEGIISEQLIYDLMGATHRPSALRKLSKQKQRVVRGFGFLFSLAEKMNRLTSLIAAARVHQSLTQKYETQTGGGDGGAGGGEPPKPPDIPFEDDAFEFGKRATDETQFIYAKYNRPRMFRGWGSLMGTFRTFVINFLETLARFWGRGSAKALLNSFVMMWAFAGVMGMAFAENIKYIIEEIVGMLTHKKPDLETAVREWGYEHTGGPEVMDYLLHGPFRHATGFDIGASVGVGDVLPFFDRNFERAPIEALIGAPAEVLLKRPGRAYGFLKEGQPYRAAETIAPEFLRNPMYAARMLKEGVRDRAGGQIVGQKDVSTADVVKKGLGFMPTGISKAYEREEAKMRIGERSEQLKKDATRALLNAIRIGDRQKAVSILKSTGPKPGVPPEEWIVINETAIEKALENTQLPPELRGLLRQPNLQRPAFLRMNKVYGGK